MFSFDVEHRPRTTYCAMSVDGKNTSNTLRLIIGPHPSVSERRPTDVVYNTLREQARSSGDQTAYLNKQYQYIPSERLTYGVYTFYCTTFLGEVASTSLN